MSYEELPNEFDIVLLGTGLVTTITAAAFSRIGLKVLHLDRNDFYGGPFANFNLEAIETWKKRNQVMYCCGDIIELLIKSDVARYCEFRTVSRVLTLLKDKLEPVPCSRADVFASKIVSLIEKRLMMKFLQFAADFENHPEEYEDHKNGTFKDFLKSKKLTPNLQHFVQHAIAMVDDSCSTEDGLTKTKKFLTSLGRYGNTAFLFPLYGSGELSQAFSRMSAVFGGVYCLMETATHILADNEANCCGIITSKGQKISCKYLIAESSYLPSNYVQRLSQGKISRAIFITDTSIEPSSDEDLTLLNFICKEDQSRPVTVLEIPSSACVCPRNLYVVYLTRKSDSDDPKEDLREVQDRLLASIDGASSDEESRPHILWSMYFTMEDWSEVSMTEEALGRVMVSSEGGDAGIDLDKCVPEAKQLFHSVCPDEEFLPTPPNPEDIIHVDDTESAVVSGAAGDFEQGNEDPEDSQQTGPDSSEVVNEESKCEEKDSEASNDKVEQ
ncbi:Rab proteins geranylgeranyltransferase component a 1 [Plakobranchus ocellatus]|uniref:Rab proteins geranylgeranyltransferase component a 1 n=1 Tax=Plakobranchus ocellatus TaxID=259542 RepID=A0AAV3YCW9_9GAST|nr:Rab proteins geranylgeranyltransferase component a 1 [Plakobranchus ocellatus]